MSRTRSAAALRIVEANEALVSTRGRIPSDPTGTFQNELDSRAPDIPKSFVEGSKARKAWDQIVPDLVKAGMITKADGPTIELAIRHYVLANKAFDVVNREGVTTEGQKGNEVKHPAESVARMHSETFLKYAQQAGLTFSSRMRTRVPEGEGHDGDSEPNPFE